MFTCYILNQRKNVIAVDNIASSFATFKADLNLTPIDFSSLTFKKVREHLSCLLFQKVCNYDATIFYGVAYLFMLKTIKFDCSEKPVECFPSFPYTYNSVGSYR